MKTTLKDAKLVQKYSSSMSGVFSISDVRSLLGERSPVLLHRRIRALEEGEVLSRFTRGFYVAPGFNREDLAARLIEPSYISLGTMLAKHLMIGSIPAATIYAVRIGKNRRYTGCGVTVEYAGISESLFFGYCTKNGIRHATAEKALLDTLYFHQHGRVFSFDIYQDIDISPIDRTIIDEWLSRYRNPRFASFVEGYLNDRG